MRVAVIGGLLLFLAGCGSNVPAHPNCLQDSDCASTDACHYPPGGASGVCVETCLSSSSCPSSEPWCIADDASSNLPFSYCACAIVGPDGGISQGCGQNSGYGCSEELQVCLPR